MTEAEWLTCNDPLAMLESLKGKVVATPRKLRLFVCASLRRALSSQLPILSVIEVAEAFIEDHVTDEERRSALSQFDAIQDRRSLRANLIWHCLTAPLNDYGYRLEWWHYAMTAALCSKQEQAAHDDATLLREVFLSPFIRRKLRVHPSWLSWNNGTIPRLAQAIYDDRVLPSGHLDNTRLAILADALEEAGCTDATILGHLRGSGPHVRGCFVIDALTGRS